MIHDLRFAVRMLLKNKVFTMVAMLSLMLGIGANTAIFSLIDAVILKRLPVKEPQELVLFSVVGDRGVAHSINYPFYEMCRDRNQSFIGVFAASGVGRGRLTVNESGGSGEVETAQQQRVSGNFFSVLGVNAVAGRTLTDSDDGTNNPQPVAIISYDFWKRRFGLDPSVIGRKIILNDTPLTIVGVTPQGFFGLEVGRKPDIWWPITLTDDPILKQNNSWWLLVMGRLRPGLSVSQARAEMNLIFRQHLDEIAGAGASTRTPMQQREHFERRIDLESGSTGWTRLRQQFRQPLLILMTIVALVLLIACANIANLLLARAAARQKEIAVRLAVGASRWRLIRQLLLESILLATAGGSLGLLFAYWCSLVLLNYLPQQSQIALDLSPSLHVLSFTLVVSVLTGLLFGIAPALQSTRFDLATSLKETTGAKRARLTLNKMLIVAQVALSLFLITGAGLFLRSLQNLKNLDPGFDREHLVQFFMDPGRGYNLAQRVNLYKQILTRLEALPGARSASFSSLGFLTGSVISYAVTVPGYLPRSDENTTCNVLTVGPRFFETMKIPILIGRDFGPQDDRTVEALPAGAQQTHASQSVVINQTMARYFFGNENPIGKRFSQTGSKSYMEIIGVSKDVRYASLREQTSCTFYLYYLQQPNQGSMTFQLRTGGDESAYAAMIQRSVRESDRKLQVTGLRSMEDIANESLAQERFIAQVASALGMFALLLACLGLYGVMSYAVTRRINEIGIRIALGAQARDIVMLVMQETMLLVMIGIAIGLLGSLTTTRLVSSMLFGLTPTDPITITLAVSLMIGVAAMAGYLPARRASSIDPMITLRCE